MATTFSSGNTHDFKLLKRSRLPIQNGVEIRVDSGYLGIAKWYPNTKIPKKKTKLHPLTAKQKEYNKSLVRERIFVELLQKH